MAQFTLLEDLRSVFENELIHMRGNETASKNKFYFFSHMTDEMNNQLSFTQI